MKRILVGLNEGSEEVRENKKEILMAQYEQFGSNPSERISYLSDLIT